MTKRFILYIILACSLLIVAGGCSDDLTPASFETEYQGYELSIPAGGNETIILEGYRYPLTVDLSDQSWLEYDVHENAGEDNDRPVTVTFHVTTEDSSKSLRQAVKITDAEGRNRVIYINTAFTPNNESNEEQLEFLTNWEKCDEVMLYYNNTKSSVSTPWSVSHAVTTNLPQSIRLDVKKSDGWEMAFSTLCDESFNGGNYFGLYNKFTGILRIFYYVYDATTTGSEFCLEVDMGNEKGDNKYPFYNALPFSIPSSHKSINNTVDINGIGAARSLKTFVSSPNTSISNALSIGWIAFDIDASAYNPSEIDWKDTNEEISIKINSAQNLLVNICGPLTAGISGTLVNEQQTTVSTTCGVSKTFRQIGSIAGTAAKPVGSITNALFGKDISGILTKVAGVCNVASSITDKLVKQPAETVIDSVVGKIELSLNGKLNLSGTIRSDVSNNCVGAKIPLTLFRAGNFGQGVWGLVNDPVVYVADDVIIGDSRNLNLLCKSDNTYAIPSEAIDNCKPRLVMFLDPESIHLGINKKVFPDISEVEILSADVIVYPEEEAGHTDSFKKVIGMTYPTIRLSDRDKGLWKLTGISDQAKDGGKKEMCYALCHSSDTFSQLLGESAESRNVYSQKGANYRYLGLLTQDYGKKIIVNPEVLLPATKPRGNSSYIYDGEIPDLIVAVTIRFKSQGRYFMYSRRFIPEIKTVSLTGKSDISGKSRLSEFHENLTRYSIKCKDGSSIGSVNGAEVRHPLGHHSVERIIKILDNLKRQIN